MGGRFMVIVLLVLGSLAPVAAGAAETQKVSRADIAAANQAATAAQQALDQATASFPARFAASQQGVRLQRAVTDAEAAHRNAQDASPQDRLDAATVLAQARKQLETARAAVAQDPEVKAASGRLTSARQELSRLQSLAKAQQEQALRTLTERGLVVQGTSVCLADESALEDVVARLAAARARVDGQRDLKRHYEDARSQQKTLSAQLATVSDPAQRNPLIERYNEAIATVNEYRSGEAVVNLAKLQDEYVKQNSAARELAAKMTATLAEKSSDPAAREALKQLNLTADQAANFGPSPKLARDLPLIEPPQAGPARADVPAVFASEVPVVAAALNGQQFHMVLDSGCSTVMLTWAVANQLGMHPTDSDETMRCTLADGHTIDAKRMTLKSVGVGPFAVQDVECAVLPASASAAELLLGGSFLREFKVELDREAGLVHLTRFGAPAASVAPRVAPVAPATPSGSVASSIPPAGEAGRNAGTTGMGTGQSGRGPALTRPAPKPVPPDANVLTDEKVGGAIKKGSDYLFAQFDPKTHTTVVDRLVIDNNGVDPDFQAGLDCMSVYALMQCNLANAQSDPRLALNSPEMLAMVGATEQFKLANMNVAGAFARAWRAAALSSYICRLYPSDGTAPRSDDAAEYAKAVKALSEDMEVCINAHENSGWDTFFSQYREVALRSLPGARLSPKVPANFWRNATDLWTDHKQNADGGWGYRENGNPSSVRLTCQALASQVLASDYVEQPQPAQPAGKVERAPFSPAVNRGLAWLENGAIVSPSGPPLMMWSSPRGGPSSVESLPYDIERLGLESGLRFLGQTDWYSDNAARIIARQRPDGSFSDAKDCGLADSAFSLIFLARGRLPVAMSKLRFDSDGTGGAGYWCNHRRDAADLAGFLGRQLGRSFNWQAVAVDTDWARWLSSPVLEVASHKDVRFTAAQLDSLRYYVEGGGMLFVQADGNSELFNRMVPKLAHDLFPRYELTAVPADHPLYSAEAGLFRMRARPDLKMVSNGSRILMLWSPHDIAEHWQRCDEKADAPELQFGANLIVYAAGQRELRNRIDSPWVPPVAAVPIATVKLARLDYPGNADPEPGAWRRYANLFQRQTGMKLDLATIKLSALAGQAPIAHLTGTSKYDFSLADSTAIKAYVEAGGVLLIDVCGGTGQFDQSVSSMLSQAFPGIAPQPLPQDHPLLAGTAPGMEDLSRRMPRFRKMVAARGVAHGTGLLILAAGKGHVIFTPLDIASGLLGSPAGGAIGFDPDYSAAFMKNLIFWTVDGQKQPVAAK
jgi:clan AA aspartic protease (TIGR02281 family)